MNCGVHNCKEILAKFEGTSILFTPHVLLSVNFKQKAKEFKVNVSLSKLQASATSKPTFPTTYLPSNHETKSTFKTKHEKTNHPNPIQPLSSGAKSLHLHVIKAQGADVLSLSRGAPSRGQRAPKQGNYMSWKFLGQRNGS